MREQLLGYLLGALDEPEQELVEERLERDPQLRAELERLSASLEPLRADRQPYPAPEGLAEQTCQYVATQVDEEKVARAAHDSSTSSSFGGGRIRRRWSLADLFVAGGVVAAAALLFFPAIVNSRFQSRLDGCQNKLRLLHLALMQYADASHGYLPSLQTRGNLAFAGVYAPILHHGGYVDEPSVFLCPSSSAAASEDRYVLPSLVRIRNSNGKRLALFQRNAGGSFGYNLGCVIGGEYRGIRHRGRVNFAVMADSPSFNLAGRQSANHGGCGQNVLFDDGHVQYLVTCQCDRDDVFLSDRGYVEAGRHVDDAVIGHSAAPPLLPNLVQDRRW